MKQIIKVDPDQIAFFKQEAGKLFFQPQAEKQLINLMKLKEMVDKAVDEVKTQIKAAGEKALGVEFRGIIGDKVKVINRFYGSKYEVTDDVLADNFIETVISRKIKTKEVDEYLKNEGKLPDGIKFKDREQTLSIIVEK